MSVQMNSNVLTNITQKRNTTSGLNLSAVQSSSVPKNMNSEVLIIPSTSTPTFGSSFICDIKEKSILLSDICLALNPSAITGLTGGTGLRWIPGAFWIPRYEIMQNGIVADTIYAPQQHILNQLLFFDEDRIIRNNLAGNYASVAQRTTLATASNTIYINLKSYIDQCNIPLLTDNHNIQIRFYLAPLVDCYTTSTAYTGTAVATINSAQLICKVLRLEPAQARNRLLAMQRQPEHNLYHSLRTGNFSVNSGVSSTNVILTPIVGSVAFLFFTVRNTNAMTGDNIFKFNPINSFNILSSSGSSVVGGQFIPSQVALQYLSQYWSRSSYTCETVAGSILTGATNDNGANVYCWSFSQDPVTALTVGQALGARQFIGAETLQINFGSALASAVSIDVFAMVETILEQSATSIKTQVL